MLLQSEDDKNQGLPRCKNLTTTTTTFICTHSCSKDNLNNHRGQRSQAAIQPGSLARFSLFCDLLFALRCCFEPFVIFVLRHSVSFTGFYTEIEPRIIEILQVHQRLFAFVACIIDNASTWYHIYSLSVKVISR